MIILGFWIFRFLRRFDGERLWPANQCHHIALYMKRARKHFNECCKILGRMEHRSLEKFLAHEAEELVHEDDALLLYVLGQKVEQPCRHFRI